LEQGWADKQCLGHSAFLPIGVGLELHRQPSDDKDDFLLEEDSVLLRLFYVVFLLRVFIKTRKDIGQGALTTAKGRM
jgi:hypothetical protein